ncbi:MAG TPA: hypothetical protein VNA67_04920 [Pseudonocardiaceae bacterium]|nr:hypothetical protein [Pseudonocardiaceae bacterium]
MSITLGTALSGSLASFCSPEHEPSYFGSLGVAAIVVGVILVGLRR